MNCNQKGQVIRIVYGGLVTIHSSGQTTDSFFYIEGIILGAGEEVYEVAGRLNGMGLDMIGEVGDKAS